MSADNNITAAKKSLHVLMTLYNKHIWNDQRTINVISEACMTKSPKLCMASSMYMLSADTGELDSDSESEIEVPNREIIGNKRSLGNKREKERKKVAAERKGRRRERRRLEA
jgi:protein SDA1